MNTLIEEAAAGSGQATIAEWIRVRRDEMRTALYAFNDRNRGNWTTAVKYHHAGDKHARQNRSLGAEAAAFFYRSSRIIEKAMAGVKRGYS